MKKILWKLHNTVGAMDQGTVLIGATSIIFLLGYLDYFTGFEFSVLLFYLMPISATAWHVNCKSALFTSVFGAASWLISNWLAGQTFIHPLTRYWNTLIIFSFFVIVTLLTANLKALIENERRLSRIDYLTGANNARALKEQITYELSRAKRYNHPITVAYIDLDDFKQVNDQFGHSAGDNLLKQVVDIMKANLRHSDVVARVGGDEFVLLLPETKENAAEQAIEKVQKALLHGMEKEERAVTFSIGALTFYEYPNTPDELLNLVDELMYQVKRSGKNNIKLNRIG